MKTGKCRAACAALVVVLTSSYATERAIAQVVEPCSPLFSAFTVRVRQQSPSAALAAVQVRVAANGQPAGTFAGSGLDVQCAVAGGVSGISAFHHCDSENLTRCVGLGALGSIEGAIATTTGIGAPSNLFDCTFVLPGVGWTPSPSDFTVTVVDYENEPPATAAPFVAVSSVTPTSLPSCL